MGEGTRSVDEGSLLEFDQLSRFIFCCFATESLAWVLVGQEEPSPGLRPPSPIASQRERGKPDEVPSGWKNFPGQPHAGGRRGKQAQSRMFRQSFPGGP